VSFSGFEEDAPLFAIGVIARMVGVHQQTIRNYERWGFITPSRTHGGTRSYSARDLREIRRVRNWMDTLGVNRAGVDVMLKLVERIEELEARSVAQEARSAALEAELNALKRKNQRL